MPAHLFSFPKVFKMDLPATFFRVLLFVCFKKECFEFCDYFVRESSTLLLNEMLMNLAKPQFIDKNYVRIF